MSAQDNGIVVKFEVRNMSAQKYDEVIKGLKAIGAGDPPGRLYHICYGNQDSLQVIDVYDSTQSFESLGQSLMPILQQFGVEVRPDIQSVYSTIAAQAGSPV